MIDLGPSTNKGVALLKILHQKEAAPIIEDEYGRWFFTEDQLGQIEQLPGMPAGFPDDPEEHFIWCAYWYTILRERFIDDALKDAIATGCKQILNLGAGFDTRFLRLIQPMFGHVETFEIDLPDTINEKTRCIHSHLGGVPEQLHLITADLASSDIGTLITHGFNPEVPTIVVLQGVSYYLPRHSALAVLKSFADDMAPGSRLVYDSCYPEMTHEGDSIPGIGVQIEKLREIGEPYLFGETPEAAAGRLSEWGCVEVDTVSMQELEIRYRDSASLPNNMWFLVRAARPGSRVD